MSDPQLHHLTCRGAEGTSSRRMGYWLWGPAEASQVVVCVHGLTRQGRDFDVLAQALLQAAGGDLRVVCPDVAGRGQSDWLADPLGYQVVGYVGDMMELLAHLQQRAPITTLDWVGTSMGGLIAMVLLGNPQLPWPVPVPVRRLVLNDVGPALQWPALQRIGSYVGRLGPFQDLDQAAAALAEVSRGFGPHTSEQWLALTRPMLRALPEGGLALHHDPAIGELARALTEEGAAQLAVGLWQVWDRITASTLLLRGDESDLLSAATAAAMGQRGPRAHLLEFAGVGHAPTLVTPKQVAPVVNFLRTGAWPDEKRVD